MRSDINSSSSLFVLFLRFVEPRQFKKHDHFLGALKFSVRKLLKIAVQCKVEKWCFNSRETILIT